MKQIRIGKDITVRWPILTNGNPASLTGRNLKLRLHTPTGQQKDIDFSTSGHQVEFVYRGIEQRSEGVYSLTLWENFGLPGQTAVDACKAFKLVSSTCCEGGGNGNLSTETADLDFAVLEIGVKGDKGEPGLQGKPGAGVPTGGADGDVLMKSETADYATRWGVVQTPFRLTPRICDMDCDISLKSVGAKTASEVETQINNRIRNSGFRVVCDRPVDLTGAYRLVHVIKKQRASSKKRVGRDGDSARFHTRQRWQRGGGDLIDATSSMRDSRTYALADEIYFQDGITAWRDGDMIRVQVRKTAGRKYARAAFAIYYDPDFSGGDWGGCAYRVSNVAWFKLNKVGRDGWHLRPDAFNGNNFNIGTEE